MKIAIIGAGFAGVATAYCLKEAGAEVTLMDEKGVAGGASGISPGLLHPYPGQKGAKAPDADAAMQATLELLKVAKQDPPRGILRLATSNEQAQHFKETAKYSDVEWQEKPPGILITSGLTIDAKAYLNGLWDSVEHLSDLDRFDATVYAMGANTPGVRVTPIKGQILKLKWPEGLSPPSRTIVYKKYLVMVDGGTACLVGATYERHFESREPDLEVARAQILPDIAELYPELADAEILGCYAGVRASPPGHYPPIIREIEPRKWAYTGLGSRGLLYHALYAKKLTSLLLASFEG